MVKSTRVYIDVGYQQLGHFYNEYHRNYAVNDPEDITNARRAINQ